MPSNDPFDILARSIYRDTKELAVRYARVPGIHIMVVQDRCIGCGKCVREGFCRFGSISIVEKKAVVNARRCRGCMRCTHLCPKGAFIIELRPPQAVNDTLRAIDNQIDRRLRELDGKV
ncbi:MAG: CoB--CoM heterodisulfide reductase iron-sulfur subunit A [Methanomassiliicoccales archaeon PtaU1.Bin124]|nr:MAG: CoB--CoM heterodisulfide reductase iron-sulfur subunit A [Methanomassiliicoccales archaeon PtaU1.Bin124]